MKCEGRAEMNAKQLPNGLDHRLKTRTVVIGGVNSLQANLNRPTSRRQRQQEETGAVVIRRGLLVRLQDQARAAFQTRDAGLRLLC